MFREFRIFFIAAIGIGTIGVLHWPGFSLAAGKSGTEAEAKQMLERAIIAIETNEAAALAAFTAGIDGFKDRDLYVFCGGPDGRLSGHGGDPKLVGREFRTIIDKNGTNLGDLFYASAKEGKLSIVEYVWPRPGETVPAPKRSYVTKVKDQICGVGYYK